jgi:hypothetical protein
LFFGKSGQSYVAQFFNTNGGGTMLKNTFQVATDIVTAMYLNADSTAFVLELDSIYQLPAIDDYAFDVLANKGALYSDHCLAHSPAGAFSVPPWYSQAFGESCIGPHSDIDSDPGFRSLATGDFVPSNMSKAVFSGTPDSAGNPTARGAILLPPRPTPGFGGGL